MFGSIRTVPVPELFFFFFSYCTVYVQRTWFEDVYELASQMFAAEYFIQGAAFPGTQHLQTPAVIQELSQLLCLWAGWKKSYGMRINTNTSVELSIGIRKWLCNCKHPAAWLVFILCISNCFWIEKLWNSWTYYLNPHYVSEWFVVYSAWKSKKNIHVTAYQLL